MSEMNATPTLRRVKHGYTAGARSLASRSVTGLARTGVTPNILTTTGVSLCLAAAVLATRLLGAVEVALGTVLLELAGHDLRLGPRRGAQRSELRGRALDLDVAGVVAGGDAAPAVRLQ